MEDEKAVVHAEEVPKEVEDKCKTAEGACPAGAVTIE